MANFQIKDKTEKTTLANTDEFLIQEANGTVSKVKAVNLPGQGAAPTITSGTYVPTVADLLGNVGISVSQCFYQRINNIVTVSGVLTFSNVTAGSLTITCSLPIASTLSNIGDLAGTCVQENTSFQGTVKNYSYSVKAETTNNEAVFVGNPDATSVSSTATFQFSYRIL